MSGYVHTVGAGPSSSRHGGRWEIAFQEENAGAACFWRRVASEVAGDGWTEDRRPALEKPELPPNTWVAFDAR
ncbi:hypothetical protein [Streptomyces sp. NPDC048508]|uniref:hypothetical protein n=1 Tax=Streptomyces sp. NPDC048508 TaxID=3365561 RepID=UPI0037134F41